MIKGFKTMIYPNMEQSQKIISFCNCARYVYNWTIATEEDNYKAGGKFISGYDIAKLLTQKKREVGMEWLRECSGRALKIAVLSAATAYENFFKHGAKHPRFKSKKNAKMSCATHEGTIVVERKRVRLEKLGWVPSHKHNIPIGEDIVYLNPKISFDGDNFWLSLSVEIGEDKTPKREQTESIGTDLGIKTLATCSNGVCYKKPDISKLKKKLHRLQRKASKTYQAMIEESKRTKIKFCKLPKSNRFLHLESDIRKTYRKIENTLNTNIHTMTRQIVDENPKAVVIEDLNVKGMLKNHKLAEKIKGG